MNAYLNRLIIPDIIILDYPGLHSLSEHPGVYDNSLFVATYASSGIEPAGWRKPCMDLAEAG